MSLRASRTPSAPDSAPALPDSALSPPEAAPPVPMVGGFIHRAIALPGFLLAWREMADQRQGEGRSADWLEGSLIVGRISVGLLPSYSNGSRYAEFVEPQFRYDGLKSAAETAGGF
jgi:hypothetical protein